MALYETTFIVNPQTDDATIDRHVQAVVDIVTAAGGKVVHENRMGTRRLAYPINGLSQGYYANFIFEAPSTVVPQMDRHMRLGEAYMRHLTVVFEGPIPDKDAPPALVDDFHYRPRAGRTDRPFGRREGGRDRGRPDSGRSDAETPPPAARKVDVASATPPAAPVETAATVTPAAAPVKPERPVAAAEPVAPAAEEVTVTPPAETEPTRPVTTPKPPAAVKESKPREAEPYREEEEL